MIHSGKDMDPPKCPSTDECIKMHSIRTVEYNSAVTKVEIMSLAATRGETQR